MHSRLQEVWADRKVLIVPATSQLSDHFEMMKSNFCRRNVCTMIGHFVRSSLQVRNAVPIHLKRFRHLKAVSSKLKYSYNYGLSEVPPLGMTIGQTIDYAADIEGDRLAFVSRHQEIRKTFSEFRKDVSHLAAGFLALGLQPGDRVGIMAPNCYEWILTQFATARAGMILVNINPALQQQELEYCIHKVRMHAIISADHFKTQDYYQILSNIVPELPSCRPGHVKSNRVKGFDTVIMISSNAKPGTFTFQEAMEAPESQHFQALNDVCLTFDDIANIQFTSGTTGSPKAAMLSHHNLVNNALSVGLRLGYMREQVTICISVPLFHCFGCVLGSLCGVLHQTTCVLPAPSFEPLACLQAVQEERCTSLYGTPAMFFDILQHKDFEKYNLTSLQSGVMAGAPCPVELLNNVITKMNMRDICVAYGTTENSPVITLSFPTDPMDKRLRTVGTPIDHVEVKIIDDNKRIVPVNTEGELCSRGYNTFLGYWDDRDSTVEVFSDARWYHTGDRAVMDQDGYVSIVGRFKDLIIRGGENIYPREIEEFLYMHPEVAEVHVVGLPDKRMGEEVCAWVKVKTDHLVSEQELREFCKGKVSHFKIPRYILFVDDFPKTESGKIQKFKMKTASIAMLKL
ncbi:medium-chain acyl-CoA ligase ACSF2, mitochondrial-like [Tachypleus tridentatus]|uniref:medium-chain acyl-CoA ligase ACSF2, mitochondrial-like n=1 Tax=Tachypleus tridentatus TaxID=6853 RepID=UPI003FD144D3